VVYDDPGERVPLPTGWTTTSDPAVIEADRVALREVAWVTREALALVREGVAQDVEFLYARGRSSAAAPIGRRRYHDRTGRHQPGGDASHSRPDPHLHGIGPRRPSRQPIRLRTAW